MNRKDKHQSSEGRYGLPRLLDALKQPTPEDMISHREGPHRQLIPYLRWQDVANLLDRACTQHRGSWEVETVWRDIKNGKAMVQCRLTLTGGDGARVSRESLGEVSLNAPAADWAPPMESAERKAMKRAAMLFGIGTDLRPAPGPAAPEPPPGEAAPAPYSAPTPEEYQAMYQGNHHQWATHSHRRPPSAGHDQCPDCGGSKGIWYMRCYPCHQALICG